LLGFKATKSGETLNQNQTKKKDSSQSQHSFGHAMVTIEVLLHKPVPQLFYVFCQITYFRL